MQSKKRDDRIVRVIRGAYLRMRLHFRPRALGLISILHRWSDDVYDFNLDTQNGARCC